MTKRNEEEKMAKSEESRKERNSLDSRLNKLMKGIPLSLKFTKRF